MNKKEINEIRRRIKPEKSAISRIYGCYVNSNKEIISDLDEPLGPMSEDEAEKYLGLLKKTLSGMPGKNLIDIIFSTQQVQDSDEHRLLSALRSSELKDGAVRHEFYQHIINKLEMEDDNYLILLAHDIYDVPYRAKDDSIQSDAGDTVFSYILCCVCPVKAGKPSLSYSPEENEFHSFASGPVVTAPELGFMFPTFDDRTANIYNALFYARNADEIHHEFIDAVFHTDAPMMAAEEREAFETALSDALDEDCRFDVVQSVHEQLRDKIDEHRESKDPEPLVVSAKEIGDVLLKCGVPEERVNVFREKCGELQIDAAMNPENIINSGKFEVSTGNTTISVEPKQSYQLETRVIDGRRYILVPADEGAEINGFSVKIKAEA